MPAAAPRSFLGRLFLLFLIVPVVDLAVLVWLGGRLGFWPTLALIALTALVGSTLAHREGLSVLARFRERLGRGEVPGRELTDGLIILVSGVLLLTPGVITDLVGLVGLLPPTRAVLRKAVSRRLQTGLLGGSLRVAPWPGRPAPPPDPNVIDADFEEVPRED